MKKYLNCNIVDVLYEVMNRNTEHYKSDFDIDKEIFTDAALSQSNKDKRLLWMSRPSGTVCVPEYDVYLENTYAHNAWKFYGEQTNDPIKAYAVKIHGLDGETVIGDLYELDYEKHYKQVKANALPIHSTIVTYESGKEITILYKPHFYDPNVKKIRYTPRDLEEWNDVLGEAQAKRLNSRYIEWDLEKLKLEYGDNNVPTYGIYQLNDNADNLLFTSYGALEKKGFTPDKNNYELVYIAENSDNYTIDEIYEKFNLDRPKDFYGHSLSVSDIIVIDGSGTPQAYYVDTFGFQEVTEVFSAGSERKKADAQM